MDRQSSPVGSPQQNSLGARRRFLRDQAGQALGIRPALEVVPLVETAPDAEITSTTLEGRTMVSIPPKGLGPSTEDLLEIDVGPGARRGGEKTNPYRPADLKAAPVTRAIGSQEVKGARR
ncbi:hypothetical protein Tco_0713184 [Tanacetum coccineum]